MPMRYEFEGCDNPECPSKAGDPDAVVTFVIPYPMGEAPSVGEKIPCPSCEAGRITRFWSSQQLIVRGSCQDAFGDGRDTVRTNVNGEDINIQFVDHPHTDPRYQAKLKKMAAEHGIGALKHAYHSEKHGGLVVDVVSNVRDPLGKIEKAKRAGGIESQTEKIKVKQPVKLPGDRPSSPRTPKRKAGGPKPKYLIPIRPS